MPVQIEVIQFEALLYQQNHGRYFLVYKKYFYILMVFAVRNFEFLQDPNIVILGHNCYEDIVIEK